MTKRNQNFKQKIRELKKAKRDCLFINDMREISEDFRGVDLEGWKVIS